MDIRKTIAAVMTAAMVLSMTACANSENPNNSTENVSGNIKIKTDYKAMWKVLPEIEETPIENLIYEYDIELAGMAITGYKAQSPKVRIPDTIEGEPVVGVNLPDSTITEIIMPNTVKRAVLNKSCLQYANYPLCLDTYEDGDSAPGSANEAFNGSKIEAIYIPKGITAIPSSAFMNCSSLKTINLPEGIAAIPDSAFKNCSSLKEINLPNTVTEINDYAFDGCKSLMKIAFSDNLSYLAPHFIDVYASEGAIITYKGKEYRVIEEEADKFNELYELINFRDGMQIRNGVLIDTVEDISEAVIPDTVTKINKGAFSGRKNLKSVIIPDSVIEIGISAFSGSENVVVTYKGKTYNYEHLSDWLVDAINLGESGMLIENGVLKDVSRELTEVVIPNNVTTIARDAFDGCTNLSSVTIPDSLTEIYDGIFKGCENLTSVTYKGETYDREHLNELYDTINMGESGMLIRNRVLVKVDNKLTELIIPASVTTIGDEAFKDCTRLTKISIPNSVTKSGRNAFDDLTDMSVTYKEDTYTYEQREDLFIAINWQGIAVIMPNLIGETVDTATAISQQKFNIVFLEEWSEHPKGEIFEQEFPEGQKIGRGSSVTVKVSKGSKGVLIQDLTNKTEAAAKKQLEADGFKVIITYENSNDLLKGYVIRTMPAANEFAERGSSVTLVVSSGKSASPVTVPNLVGLMLDEAINRCEEYHLLAEWNIKSDSAKKGMVIAQSIPENTSVYKYTEITLTVSEGAE